MGGNGKSEPLKKKKKKKKKSKLSQHREKVTPTKNINVTQIKTPKK